MATTIDHTTEVPMKLRLSRQATEKLSQRATKSCQDVAEVAASLIEQAIAQPLIEGKTLGIQHQAECDDEQLTYNPVPPRRSSTVQIQVSHHHRGQPAAFELEAE